VECLLFSIAAVGALMGPEAVNYTKQTLGNIGTSAYFPLCTIIRATKIDRRLICNQFSSFSNPHTENRCYIDRSIVVAVIRMAEREIERRVSVPRTVISLRTESIYGYDGGKSA